jgi:uncharacterized protein (TIRG00374 family)
MIEAASERSGSPQDPDTDPAPGADPGSSRADCFGRDVFESPEVEPVTPPEELREPVRRRGALQFIRAHRLFFGLLFTAALITAFVVGVLPQVTGLGNTLKRVGRGNHLWLAVGIALEAISIGGYVMLFRAVFSCEGTRIGWKASYEITLAGVVATKLLAAAGAGGIALTAWALRAAGLSGRTIARRMAGFEIFLYGLFMVTLLIVGLLLGTGAVGTHAGWTVSYLPAAFGGLVITLALVARFLPNQFEHALSRVPPRRRRLTKVLSRLAAVPKAIRDGMDTDTELIKDLNFGVLGAVAYWAFDIATLWTSFKAFGASEPVVVIIMGYYVGQLANAIPLPGGIGGVEGGMIGCFIALGVNAGAAIVGVFAYRAISFWLPTVPGALAYLQLRRRIAGWRATEAPAEG